MCHISYSKDIKIFSLQFHNSFVFKPVRLTFLCGAGYQINCIICSHFFFPPFPCCVHCGKNILYFPTVFELSHVTCFGE